MKNNRPDIRCITLEDFENLNLEECRVLKSSSLIVRVVRKNEEQNSIQSCKPPKNDLQRVTRADALLSWDQPRTKECSRYRCIC